MAQEQLRQFLRAEVAMAVGPLVAPSLQWSTTQLPTLQFVDALRDLPCLWCFYIDLPLLSLHYSRAALFSIRRYSP